MFFLPVFKIPTRYTILEVHCSRTGEAEDNYYVAVDFDYAIDNEFPELESTIIHMVDPDLYYETYTFKAVNVSRNGDEENA